MQLASPYGIKTIDLAKLVVADESSVFEIRKKISQLFALLGHDIFYTTYISTLFSDLCRESLGRKAAVIGVAIHSSPTAYYFKFSFSIKLSHEIERRILAFFDDDAEGFRSKNSSTEVFIKIDQESISRRTLDDMQEILSYRSKEELYHELEKTYTQLNASKKMAQMEKMSAVGTLSAGIAHELNNPLMGIINFVQYCIKHTPEEDKRHGILTDAKREALRCAELIQNLLSFSRHDDDSPEELLTEAMSVGPIIDEVLKLLLYRIEKEKIVVLRKNGPTILAPINRNQIKQVLLNVVTNALDAMMTSKKKVVEIVSVQEEGMLSITIKDSGAGISSASMARIFDPFFTTKPAGQGTGLGLSISQNIIKKHAGEIRVRSDKSSGTIFDIRLPLMRSGHA